ncbi:hypothetical protein [Rhodococcus erythropolis]|uniref:hypothetical protein n=1 Tax=Rhodococcus erythropolis TaxID=1833 RepID=UPI0040423DD8
MQDTASTEATAAAADEAEVVTVAEAVAGWLGAQRINPTTLTAALAPWSPALVVAMCGRSAMGGGAARPGPRSW